MEGPSQNANRNTVLTEECLQEMKRQDRDRIAHSLLVTHTCGLSQLINCEVYIVRLTGC